MSKYKFRPCAGCGMWIGSKTGTRLRCAPCNVALRRICQRTRLRQLRADDPAFRERERIKNRKSNQKSRTRLLKHGLNSRGLPFLTERARKISEGHVARKRAMSPPPG